MASRQTAAQAPAGATELTSSDSAPITVGIQSTPAQHLAAGVAIMSAANAAATAAITSRQDFAGYSANVVFSTLLFLIMFSAGTAWTLAVKEQFERKQETYRYWVFAIAMTLLTIGAAIGFGELARLLSKRININIGNFLGAEIE
jgi:hypothetical protein